MATGKAAVAIGSSALGGLTSAVLTGGSLSGVADVFIAAFLVILGVFVLTALAIGIVAVVAGIRATFASTPEAQGTALKVFTDSIGALRAHLLGLPHGLRLAREAETALMDTSEAQNNTAPADPPASGL